MCSSTKQHCAHAADEQQGCKDMCSLPDADDLDNIVVHGASLEPNVRTHDT